MFHYIFNRMQTENFPEIVCQQTGEGMKQTGNNFDLLDKIEKTDYKLLRYWSSSEEETESDESEGEPEEGALPTQLMGFRSVKVDVSQTLFERD